MAMLILIVLIIQFHQPNKPMPETRKQDQFKIYTLHANVDIVLGKKDDKEVTRTDRVPVAVFDDNKLLKTYVDKTTILFDRHKSYEVVEDWVEYKPVADKFSLPFNPAPITTVEPKDNGNN